MIVTTRLARDAMDAAASGRLLPDEIAAAYGKVVWSWRRDRGVYFAGGIPQTTVTKTPLTGESTKETVKTIARGKPGLFG
jgi:hypothetical protein